MISFGRCPSRWWIGLNVEWVRYQRGGRGLWVEIGLGWWQLDLDRHT